VPLSLAYQKDLASHVPRIRVVVVVVFVVVVVVVIVVVVVS
jgi:hypothetical protein